jgi:hypothetical protein
MLGKGLHYCITFHVFLLLIFRYVHGSRLVRTLHSAWPSTRCRMQVLDFCVYPNRVGAESDRKDEAADLAERNVPCAHRLVAGPSLICDRGFRGGGVESRLPYREATLKQEFGPYSGFMIDEERVIGLSVRFFNDLHVISVMALTAFSGHDICQWRHEAD